MQEIQKTRVPSLGWEIPLEYEMATHSSILAWKIPWAEEPDRLQSLGRKESDTAKHMTHNMDITCMNPEISFIFLDKLFPLTFFLRSWRLSFRQSIQVIIKVDMETI